MAKNVCSRRLLLVLISGALVLPVAICVVVGVSFLLREMGDPVGGAVLGRIALGCGILWVVDLICLLVVQGLNALNKSDESEQSK